MGLLPVSNHSRQLNVKVAVPGGKTTPQMHVGHVDADGCIPTPTLSLIPTCVVLYTFYLYTFIHLREL